MRHFSFRCNPQSPAREDVVICCCSAGQTRIGIKSNGQLDIIRTQAGAIAQDDTLETAVWISLFTDRRALPDDVLPETSIAGPLPPDRRGWCGDAIADITDDRIGCRWWLLARAKQTEETRRLAEDYAIEALQWMIDDGVATKVTATASWPVPGVLTAAIVIALPNGSVYSKTFNVKAGGYAI